MIAMYVLQQPMPLDYSYASATTALPLDDSYVCATTANNVQ